MAAAKCYFSLNEALLQLEYCPKSSFEPSGVSSRSISNHSGWYSMRAFSVGLRSATFVVRAMTASPSATFGWHFGKFCGSGCRMHHAQCSISSVYPRLGGPSPKANLPTAAAAPPLAVYRAPAHLSPSPRQYLFLYRFLCTASLPARDPKSVFPSFLARPRRNRRIHSR